MLSSCRDQERLYKVTALTRVLTLLLLANCVSQSSRLLDNCLGHSSFLAAPENWTLGN